jgi:hypothetical protein
MIHAEYRYHLDVAPELAFEYLADPANDAQWQGSCLEAERLAPAPDVGTRYRIVFSFMGRRVAFVGEITQRTAPRDYAFRVVEGPFHYEGRYSLQPAVGGGTDVHWQFWAQPARFFGIVPASLLRKVLVSQVEKDVVRLRERFATQAA